MTKYVERTLEKRTQAHYNHDKQLLLRIYDSPGHFYPDKITPWQLQKFINSLGEPGDNQTHEGEGLSPKSIKNYLFRTSTIFHYTAKMDSCRKTVQVSFISSCEGWK